MDQEAVLRDRVLTQPCPHCAEQLRLYIVRPGTDSCLPGFALAGPDRVPPADSVLVWALAGMDALNSFLDRDFVTHPTYVCPRTDYPRLVAEQWAAPVGEGTSCAN